MDLSQLTHLGSIPVSPSFEQALGYEGDARFVAFYWTPAGDELMYTDERSSSTGDYAPWLLWQRHISVAPALFGLDFGSSDSEAKHWLLLDRKDRQLYAGEVKTVSRFLHELPEAVSAREAWEGLSEADQARLQAEAWEHFQKALENLPQPTPEDVACQMQESRKHYRKLQMWLDQQTVVCPACSYSAPAALWERSQHTCLDCGKAYWMALVTERSNRLRGG